MTSNEIGFVLLSAELTILITLVLAMSMIRILKHHAVSPLLHILCVGLSQACTICTLKALLPTPVSKSPSHADEGLAILNVQLIILFTILALIRTPRNYYVLVRHFLEFAPLSLPILTQFLDLVACGFSLPFQVTCATSFPI